jgi:L-aminopeptidase/D-esterase-like protein
MTHFPDSICDVPGVLVGHAQNDVAKTGCTVVIPEHGAVAGVDIRGSAPGTREVDTLRPVRLVTRIHAILLTGGSAFGLDAAGGVMTYLEEKDVGHDVGVTRVPIVPNAVIFDLDEGASGIRPDKEMGYAAAAAAASQFPGFGRKGAGRGATVGKLLGHRHGMKGGIGSASTRINDIWIGALVVVNALGDIVDSASHQVIAGAVDPETGAFIDSVQFLRDHPVQPFQTGTNTTLAVVATDAELSKDDVTKLAQMAQDGLSRTIRPAHTPFDGDLVFGLSAGHQSNVAGVMTIGAIAAELVSESIVRAVTSADQ